MSCILRISTSRASQDLLLAKMRAYRVEDGTAHFVVSEADLDEFTTQVNEAIGFLLENSTDIKILMNEPDASGVLDFAIAWRDVVMQNDFFPAELVRLAGSLGLALNIAHCAVS